jgi:arylsulfatase A-like enzyme
MFDRAFIALSMVGKPTVAILGGLVLWASAAAAEVRNAPPKPPNILVILADDLGFSDLGCYGSEIETPNLDQIASDGLRFTQYSTTAKCHSSRVSLLSGRWCRQAGDESLSRAVTIPEVLGSAGYFTAMAGKWHLEREPTHFGFDRYFGHLSGATDYYRGDNTFRLSGRPWKVPTEGFYTTVANVDHAIGFLDEARGENKPWFLYLAFNAPHAPLQPLEEDYNRCIGRYDVGWDEVRAARVAKQKRIGLFGGDVEAAARPPHIPAWDTLSSETRTWEARRMAAYAALIERLDREVGRLLRDLESNGESRNTLILFFSDNGACPYDRRTVGRDREPYEPGAKWSDSTGWAWVRNTPFRYYKQNQFEGGIATPAIAHWPAGLKTQPGARVHTPAHLVDILPTLAEIAGAPVPTTWPGRELSPLAGVSLVPIFNAAPLPARPPIHLLFGSDRGLRDGDWKIVSFRGQPWELYDIARDRTELHDLAGDHPEIVARMAKEWHDMTANVLQAPAKERAPVAQTVTEQLNREWTVFSGGTAAEGDLQPADR